MYSIGSKVLERTEGQDANKGRSGGAFAAEGAFTEASDNRYISGCSRRGGVCRWMTPQDVAVPHDTLHASVRPVTQIHHTHAHPLHRHTLHGHALHGHTLSTDTLSTDTLSRRTRAREVD